jgi:pimeloyl-ACP methyl ester carboxylesterase
MRSGLPGALAGVYLVGCSVLLVGCSQASPGAASSTGGASSAAAAADGLSDGMVALPDGRQIHVTCAGADQSGPTVVLVSGAQSAGDAWMAVRKAGATGMALSDMSRVTSAEAPAVFGQVSAFAPVCAYDRPGTLELDGTVSATTVVDQPTTAQQDVADLAAWLAAAQLPPPYVLVGHSWGGMVATLFAATYPSRTAGLVLVDPATAYLEDHLTGPQWQAFLALPDRLIDGSRKEAPDYRGSVDAVRIARVGDIPIVVLTSDKPFNFGIGLDAWPAWLAAADSLASALSADHVTSTSSGHLIPIENPGVVVTAVRHTIDEVR